MSSILFIITVSYLQMAAKSCMVQRRAAGPFWHIHIAEQRDEGLGAAHGLVGRGNVQRSLPVLVSGIHICRVFQQHLDGLLRGKRSNGDKWVKVWSGWRECARMFLLPGRRARTSLQDATARCSGVSHLLSLALTLAPVNQSSNT